MQQRAPQRDGVCWGDGVGVVMVMVCGCVWMGVLGVGRSAGGDMCVSVVGCATKTLTPHAETMTPIPVRVFAFVRVFMCPRVYVFMCLCVHAFMCVLCVCNSWKPQPSSGGRACGCRIGAVPACGTHPPTPPPTRKMRSTSLPIVVLLDK